jgi:large subunit ribosomal protein L4
MRREALRAAVAAKIAAGELKVLERVEPADGKTKALVTWLRGLGLEAAPTLLVVETLGPAVRRAAGNVSWLTVETPSHVSVYQLLQARQAVFERAALLKLETALASDAGAPAAPAKAAP